MITVTVTQLRANMFEYMDKVAAGEIVVIRRNGEDVARLVPLTPDNWRVAMPERVTINVSDAELIAPIEEIWDDYA